MLRILAQHDVEMAWPGDQEVVKAFPSHGADEAFRDRVRPGCPDRGADDLDIGAGEHSVERAGKLRVSVPDGEYGMMDGPPSGWPSWVAVGPM